jgi:hypothetical protein
MSLSRWSKSSAFRRTRSRMWGHGARPLDRDELLDFRQREAESLCLSDERQQVQSIGAVEAVTCRSATTSPRFGQLKASHQANAALGIFEPCPRSVRLSKEGRGAAFAVRMRSSCGSSRNLAPLALRPARSMWPTGAAPSQRAESSPGSMPAEPTYGSMSQMRAAVRAQPGRRPRFSLKSRD